MTKEFVQSVIYADLERAYAAYNVLMSVYEYRCGGPRGAMAHKEYFAIRDSRDNIRMEVIKRSKEASHGDGQ